MDIEVAKKRCNKIINDTNETIRGAKKNGAINTIQLTVSLENDSIAIETVLNELEKKDKVINEMAEYIDKITFVDEQGDYGCDFELLTNATCNYDDCKKCIKEYFTNKAENVGE